MDRKEYVEEKLAQSRERSEKTRKLQELYDRYLSQENQQNLMELLNAALDYGTKIMLQQTSWTANFSRADREDLRQEGMEILYTVLMEKKKNGEYIQNFGSYAWKVLRNRAGTYAAAQKRQVGEYNWEPLQKQNDDSETYEVYGEESLEKELFCREQGRRRKLSVLCLRWYAEEMLKYSGEPQKALGLCYGRLLYQLEPFCSQDRISTAISDMAWCERRMGRRNLKTLSEDAEQSLSGSFHCPMKWCETYREYLKKPSSVSPEKLWGELVYQDEFTRKQTSHWVESIHKTLKKRLIMRIRENPEVYGQLEALSSHLVNNLIPEEAYR